MLILEKMISHGRVRACFYHPEDAGKCVKVAMKKRHEHLLNKEIKNNILFQEKLSPYVPQYYQLIQTNKGVGLETELITDDNHDLSPRLCDYLKTHKTIPLDIKAQFDDFFERLFVHKLWFYDFNVENFLIQTTQQQKRIVFVDTKSFNRNNSWSFCKLEYYISFLAKIRMRRRIIRFYEHLHLSVPKGILD